MTEPTYISISHWGMFEATLVPSKNFVSLREQLEQQRAADPKIAAVAEAIMKRVVLLSLSPSMAYEAASAALDFLASGMVNPYKKQRPIAPQHINEEL